MSNQPFAEGVKPGGLTTGPEIRILLCYLLDSVNTPVSRQQLEDVVLGEELANYFVMADSLAGVVEQGLVEQTEAGYRITPAGRTVGRTLADEVPRTVREAAVRGVIRAQQYAAKAAAHHSEISKNETGLSVNCQIGDTAGPLFQMQLYMPDELTASAVREKFISKGNEVYKLVLAALTDDRALAENALHHIGKSEE